MLIRIALLFCFFASHPAFADNGECKPLEDIQARFTPAVDGALTILALRADNDLQHVIVFERALSETSSAAWELWQSQRGAPPDMFCLTVGDSTESLASLEENESEFRFGLPGEGFPRCSTKDDIIASISVRLWANKELGPSIVEVLNAENRSYTLLVSRTDFRWVLIENSEERSCYQSRGDTISVLAANKI